jgi:hypothetical protein
MALHGAVRVMPLARAAGNWDSGRLNDTLRYSQIWAGCSMGGPACVLGGTGRGSEAAAAAAPAPPPAALLLPSI